MDNPVLRRLDVDVYAHFSCDGTIMPKAMYNYKEEQCIPIIRVLDITKMANTRVGGRGLRYRVIMPMTKADGETVEVRRTLWLEDTVWFVEEEIEGVA